MAKYNNKKSLSLHNDDNEYCIGFCGNGDTKRCDFYVNKELMFQGIPFRKGNSVKVLKSGYFINVKDSQGINRVIRDGKVVFSTHRHVVNAYAHLDYDADGIEFISKTYLIIVSRNGLFGICSSKGHLILPIKYSTI